MAFHVTTNKEFPQFTLVRDYAVHRIGEFPHVSIRYAEVVYLSEPHLVTAAFDENEDGFFDVLEIPTLVNRSDLAGRPILDERNEIINHIAEVITTWTEEVKDPETGEVITPSVPVVRVRLVDALERDLTGVTIGIMAVTPVVGSPAYRPAHGGAEWEAQLWGNNPAAMQRLAEILANVHYEAAKSVLDQLILAKGGQTSLESLSENDIRTAVHAAMAAGKNVDGLLATEAEKLEMDRQAGLAPYVVTIGKAPLVAGGNSQS